MDGNFKPTYLYIKQHTITKLLYFGKTTLSHERMLHYVGSGDRWINHLKVHGAEYVTTVWYCLYYDKTECEQFALSFSENQNIVESTNWANLILENGISGFPAGLKFDNEHKKKLSNAKKGKTWEEIFGVDGAKLRREQNSKPKGAMDSDRRKRISNTKKGMNPPHDWSEESRKKASESCRGIKKSHETIQKMKQSAKIIKTCPHCGASGSGPVIQRWHFNNCKNK